MGCLEFDVTVSQIRIRERDCFAIFSVIAYLFLFNLGQAKMRFMKQSNLFHELLKSNTLASSRFLGLDVGDKYVGLAVSDATNTVASPLAVLLRKRTNIDLMAKDLQSLVSELSLGGFVFGYPFDRQKTSRTALQIKVFIDDLCKTGELKGVNYTFMGEGFTSKNVESFLQDLKFRPTQSKTLLDKFAAVGILQLYLDYVNRKQAKEALISLVPNTNLQLI
ncbi:putative pre-16S rRNA nuclease isoform X1 [Capsicum chacoense]